GFPVACYGGRRDLMELVAPCGPVYQAGTLSATPVGMRAGLATLKKIEQESAYEKLEKKTASFCESLTQEFHKRSLPFQFTRFASIFWLHVQSDGVIRRIDQIPAKHA